jgi:DNA-binding transcriptional LysR family regulator
MEIDRQQAQESGQGDDPAGPRREGARAPAIELRHLRYFLTVSEELHFRRAADRLHIAQPPLSQAIRRLEEELGVQLLERTSRAVSLTEAGRVFREDARRVLAELDTAVADARRAAGSGYTLRIGCTPFVPFRRLLAFLDALRSHEPSLRPDVKHLMSVEQIAQLHRGELDLAVIPVAGRQKRLTVEPLFPPEPLVAYLRPDHPLTHEPVLRPDLLAGETLVTVDRALNPTLVDHLWKQLEVAGYSFRSFHEAGGEPRDWLLAVAAGAGVAILPESALELGGAGARVVTRPLDPPLEVPAVVVAWRTPAPERLRPLIEALRRVGATLRGEAES